MTEYLTDFMWLAAILGFFGGIIGSALTMVAIAYLFEKSKK